MHGQEGNEARVPERVINFNQTKADLATSVTNLKNALKREGNALSVATRIRPEIAACHGHRLPTHQESRMHGYLHYF